MTLLQRLCLVAGVVVGILSPRHDADAASSRGRLEMSAEVMLNGVDGPKRLACGGPQEIESYIRKAWWITIADRRAASREGEDTTAAAVTCGSGPSPSGSSAADDAQGEPLVIAEVSAFVGPRPWTLTPARVLVLDLDLSLRRFSAREETGEPISTETRSERKVALVEGGDFVVPLLVAGDSEIEGLAIRELFLKLATSRARDPSKATYGEVTVSADDPGSDVLLDGGVVGQIQQSGEITLENVPAGLRLVGVRDASGDEAVEVVRVEAGRRAVVSFDRAESQRETTRFELLPLGKNEQGFEEYRRGRDQAVVVRIPAGEFLMGNQETEREPLEHRVYVSEFLIDKTGVTWGQYERFAAATGTPLPPHEPYWGTLADHPAVFVTWEEAKAYCEWAGGRLPTEAEREKAARGTDERKYPWGDEEPTPELGVFRRTWGREATAAVGTHPAGASPYGLLDMGGNVWEWCSDWYDDDYFEVSPYRDPKGPSSGIAHVLRGGSWDSRPTVLSASCRNWGHRGYREGDFGFRCAMNAPAAQE